MPTEPTIRNISDTAIWAAIYRARETERPDALFRDPFARRLTGEHGDRIAAEMKSHDRHAWAWIVRTLLFDRFVTEGVARGVDMVVNLAAGLDARPYRMALPPALQWIEVDLPDLLAYKEGILSGEKPACALERVALDLSNVAARRELFRRLGGRAKSALIMTEGLLIYLTEDEVGALAQDLADPDGFRQWVLDLASPGLVRMLQRQVGATLDSAGAPLKFGPAEGPGFFARYGWRAIEVRTVLKEGARTKRAPFFLRLIAMLPEPSGPPGPSRVWSGICRLEKQKV